MGIFLCVSPQYLFLPFQVLLPGRVHLSPLATAFLLDSVARHLSNQTSANLIVCYFFCPPPLSTITTKLNANPAQLTERGYSH